MPDDASTPARSRSGSAIGAARQQSILSLIARGEVIAVGEFAKRFDVSPETIRRDMRSLEQEGLLRRVHGGAVAANPAIDKSARRPVVERFDLDRDAKRLAAEAALPLFEDDMNVFIGASSTMLFLAEVLARSGKSLSVTTNMLDVAITLASVPSFSVNLIGGQVHMHTRAIGGYEALRSIEQRLFDLAIVGGSALSLEFGVLGYSRSQTEIVTALAERSTTMAFAMHRRKIGGRDAHIVLPLRHVSALATDGELPPKQRRILDAAGVRVLVPTSSTST